MVSGFPMLFSDTAISTLQSWPVHQTSCSTTSTATIIKLSRKPSSLRACCVPKLSAGIQLSRGCQNLESLEMSNRKMSTSETTLKILGMDIECNLSASLNAKIPSMHSLLPLLSTGLGYFIIATSTVTKLPQVPVSSVMN